MRNVVDGVDTNVMILCDLNSQMDAPFWRINDRVYDFFHVPAYFRVERYITLTIPEVNLSLNNYIFQCVLIDHTTDPIREIHGIQTKLIVNENNFNGMYIIRTSNVIIEYMMKFNSLKKKAKIFFKV